MYRTALALTSAALMLTATTAAAQETEPPPEPLPPINACGGMLAVEEVKNNLKSRETRTGFVTTGTRVLRLSDENSSVVVPERAGRFSVELSEPVDTVTSTGRTLLVPDEPDLIDAIEEAGLPEFPLIVGRIVIEDTGPGSTPRNISIVSVQGRVVDVCELLDR